MLWMVLNVINSSNKRRLCERCYVCMNSENMLCKLWSLQRWKENLPLCKSLWPLKPELVFWPLKPEQLCSCFLFLSCGIKLLKTGFAIWLPLPRTPLFLHMLTCHCTDSPLKIRCLCTFMQNKLTSNRIRVWFLKRNPRKNTWMQGYVVSLKG